MKRIAVGILAAELSISGCAPALLTAQGGRHPGSLFVRWPSSAAFGLPVGDTLPEVDRANVPPVVIVAADSFSTRFSAEGVRWDAACTRFFRGPDRFAVVFVSACDPASRVGIRDMRPTLAVFLADGTLVVPPERFRGFEVHFDVRPETRVDPSTGLGSSRPR